MLKFLAPLLLVVFSSLSQAAEDFNIWDSQTFAGPYTDGVVATSASFNNLQGHTGLEVVVEYETLVPDGKDAGADYRLYAIVEQKSGTHWYPAAVQYKHINNSESPNTRIISMTPTAPSDFVGFENILAVGSQPVAAVSYNSGSLGSDFRVKLLVDNGGSYPLTSVTVTAYGRKVN